MFELIYVYKNLSIYNEKYIRFAKVSLFNASINTNGCHVEQKMYTCLANSLYSLLLIHYRDIINHEHDMVIMLPIGLCLNNVCLLFYCQSFIFYLWEWPCLYLQTHAGMEWLWVWGINCRVASGDFWILPQVSQSQIDTDHLKIKQQLT